MFLSTWLDLSFFLFPWIFNERSRAAEARATICRVLEHATVEKAYHPPPTFIDSPPVEFNRVAARVVVGLSVFRGRLAIVWGNFRRPPRRRNSVARVSKFCTCRCRVFTPHDDTTVDCECTALGDVLFLLDCSMMKLWLEFRMDSIVSRFYGRFPRNSFLGRTVYIFSLWRDTRFIPAIRFWRDTWRFPFFFFLFSVIEEENVTQNREKQQEENVESLLNDEPGK